jgi:4-diphosphocytidyl-2-C-methyl-D-erythritol kinase
MRLLAPAKINLHLRVGPADSASGFHPLMSWMCTVGLFDKLTIEYAIRSVQDVLFECADPQIPCDETNLVVRAVREMHRDGATVGMGAPPLAPGSARGHPRQKVRLHLEKRIPIGAGLGGGSSDAARTLLGLNRQWELDWPVARLSRIAATLGSDVPFFLHGPSSICSGRGEVVRPIARPRVRFVVLVLPDLAMPTPAVYRKFDELRLGERASIEHQPSWDEWANLLARPLLSRLINDLEAPAFAIAPQLATLRAAIESTLGQPVRMSGSGSSLFTLFDEKDEAHSAAARITDCHGVRALATELAPVFKDDLEI